jgi:hypothetical protein
MEKKQPLQHYSIQYTVYRFSYLAVISSKKSSRMCWQSLLLPSTRGGTTPSPFYLAVADKVEINFNSFERDCAAHGTFRYFELCSICLREGLGRSKPAINPWNKHNNTTVGISTISKPYWTVFYRIKWALQVWVSWAIYSWQVQSAYNSVRSRC